MHPEGGDEKVAHAPLRGGADRVVEANPAGTLLVDSDMRCEWANPALAAMAGLPLDRIVARPVVEVLPVLAQHLAPILRLTLDTAVPMVDVEVVVEPTEPSGHARRFVFSSFPVRGAANGVMSAGATIIETAMTAREQGILGREALFRGIFDHAAVAIMALEWRGKAFRMNAAASALFGYSEAELTQVGVAAMSHPEDFAADLALFQRLMAGEIDRYELVKRYIRKDGEVIWGKLVVSLAREPNGEPALIVSMVEDITERKRAEGERDRLIRELEEAVTAREVFLSIASHELRTPLTALQLDLEWILRRTEQAAQQPTAGLVRAIRQTNRLGVLVETLLDVSRIGVGRLSHEREPLDLVDLMREAVERFRPEAEVAGCELSFAEAPPLVVRADRLRMEQVLGNLFANALKFGRGKPIELWVERDGSLARLGIRDHGIGIPKAETERIFERFDRAVSEQQYGGLGLGLFIARQIVQAHEGRLTVESEEGRGATFLVELRLGLGLGNDG